MRWAGKKPTADEWRGILERHAAWLRGEMQGERADLTDAVLTRADLTGAVLTRADLTRADLTGAVLTRADLTGAEHSALVIARTRILPEGALIGWKKCRDGVLVKLLIPADAKRSHAFGRKCRAEYADVLEVIGAEVGKSLFAAEFEYRAGQRVQPDEWNPDWTNECSGGIHFFITREEAEVWN